MSTLVNRVYTLTCNDARKARQTSNKACPATSFLNGTTVFSFLLLLWEMIVGFPVIVAASCNSAISEEQQTV